MSLEGFLRGRGADRQPHEIHRDAVKLLDWITMDRSRTDHLLSQPPGVATTHFKEPGTECVLRLLSGEWGV